MAQQAQAQGGMPQAGAVAGEGQDLSSLLMQLRSGQVSAESLIQLLALLSGAGGLPGGGGPGPGGGMGPGGPGTEIEAAFMGQ